MMSQTLQVAENVGALQVKLTADEVQEIEAVADAFRPQVDAVETRVRDEVLRFRGPPAGHADAWGQDFEEL